MRILKDTVRQFLAHDCMGLAQQIAFSALLAFFPAAAALLALLGMLGVYHQVETLVGSVAPGGVTGFVDGLRRDTGNASALVFVLGLAGALWAASGAMATIMKALNRTHGHAETRPIWRVRIIAAGLVVACAVVLAGTLALIVFGGPLGTAIANRAGLGAAFTVTWNLLRWPLMLAALLGFLALLYAVGPDESPRRWRWISPGAIAAALLWLGLSGLFALYVSLAGSYTRTYGTLASGVILLLWLSYSGVALLFGAELDATLQSASSRASDARPSGTCTSPPSVSPPASSHP